MNADILRGKWKQFKGEAKQKWGKLTGDDLAEINGSKDRLVGVLQERYGKSKEAAEEEVDAWRTRS
jgi:uncharacterized protein YjbJ (UPF0337 family)